MNPVGGSKIFIGLRVASKSEVTASDFVGQDWVEIGGLTNIDQLGDSQEVVSQAIISGGRTRQTKGTVVGQVMENTFLPIWNDPGQARFLAAVKSCHTYAFKVEWSQGCDDDPLVDMFYGFALSGARLAGDSNSAQLRNGSIAVDSNVVEAVGMDPAAVAVIDRMTPKPSLGGQARVDAYVKASKASGEWDLSIGIYFTGFDDVNWSAQESRINAKLNWRQDLYNLTEVGALTFTRGRGFKGDGATGYLSTGFVAGAALDPLYTQNNAEISMWNLAEGREDFPSIGHGPGTRQSTIIPRRSAAGGEILASINGNNQFASALAPPSAIGLTAVSRVDAANASIYKDGIHVITLARASNTLTATEPLTLLARGGSAQFSSLWEVAYARFGAALNVAQQAQRFDAVRNLFGAPNPIHVIGDSFATGSFARGMLKASPHPYQTLSIDGVGGSTLAGQAIRFSTTPEYYNRTLMIMDGGLTDTTASAISAIQDMVTRLPHNRWGYIYPGPQDTQIAGDPSRIVWDQKVSDITAAIGSDRVVTWLAQIMAANDGTTNDLVDVANNIPPRSLRQDGHHLTNDTEGRVGDGAHGDSYPAGQAIDYLNAMGWVF